MTHRTRPPTDVVVVGTGAAALAAALAAHDRRGPGRPSSSARRRWAAPPPSRAAASGCRRTTTWPSSASDDSREEALAYMGRLTAGRTPVGAPRALRRPRAGHRGRAREAPPRCGSRPCRGPTTTPRWRGPSRPGGCSSPSCSTPRGSGRGPTGSGRPRCWGCPSPSRRPPPTGGRSYFPERFDAAEVQRRVADRRVACGQALIGALLDACLQRGIEPRARDPGRGDRHGRTARWPDWWSSRRPAHARRPPARRSCWPSGGYEWNATLRDRFLPGPLTHPHSPPANEGDGLLMAMEVGADLANMNETWWYPASSVPGEQYEGRPLARFVGVERTAPHSVIVDRFGQRFVNEAANYNDMQKAFFSFDANEYSTRHLPCWVVFDRQYRSRYPVVGGPARRSRPRLAAGARHPRGPGRRGGDRPGRAWPRPSSGGTGSSPTGGTGTSAGGRAPTTGSTATRRHRTPTWAPSRRGRSTPCPSTSGSVGTKGGPRVDGRRTGPPRAGPSHPRAVRRRQRRRQPGRARLLRRRHVDRHGPGLGPPGRRPRGRRYVGDRRRRPDERTAPERAPDRRAAGGGCTS